MLLSTCEIAISKRVVPNGFLCRSTTRYGKRYKRSHAENFEGYQGCFPVVDVWQSINRPFKSTQGGRGVPELRMAKLEFYVVYDRKDPSYQMLFTGSKILFIAKVITFGNLENTGYYSMCSDFNRDFPKMTTFGIKIPIFSYIFYTIILKLSLVVLGLIMNFCLL